jgi:uroporphyrinogen-III decarboxylase
MAGTPAKVEEFVKNILKDLKPGGGFIMSPAVSMPSTAKPENVKSLVNAVKKYGGY